MNHDMIQSPSFQTKTWFDALTKDLVRKDDDPSYLDSNSKSKLFSRHEITIIETTILKPYSPSDQRVRIVGPEAQNI